MSEKQYYYFVVQVKDKSEKYYYSYVERVHHEDNLACYKWTHLPNAIVWAIMIAPSKKEAERLVAMYNKTWKDENILWDYIKEI